MITLNYASSLTFCVFCKAAFNSALTERKQPEQTWRLLPWFCAIILFPLLVIIYWGFIKTEWVRAQPGSVNRPLPQRQPKSAFPFYTFPLFPSYLLLLFLFFPLSPLLSSSPLWRNRGVFLQFNLQLRVSSVGPKPMWLCRLFCVKAS